MEKGRELVAEVFGNRLRVRVSGICIENNKILLINHRGVNSEDEFWAPPGGGMDFGTSAEENLVREFNEETGLKVEVTDFLCVNEFLGLPLHAVELFFQVKITGGYLKKGLDPELSGEIEIIKEVEFKTWDWIRTQSRQKLHNILTTAESLESLCNVNGYILQKKNK